MRTILCAAAAAATFATAQANAATYTYVTYTGTGHGSFTEQSILTNQTLKVSASALTYTLTFNADLHTCGVQICSFSDTGAGDHVSAPPFSDEKLTINFSPSGGPYAIDPSLFLGGTAQATYTIPYGPPYTADFWSATLDTVQISTFTSDNGLLGGLGLTWTSVPEPATWALMIAGFAAAGISMRCARRNQRLASPDFA